jgi:hypothetical protein
MHESLPGSDPPRGASFRETPQPATQNLFSGKPTLQPSAQKRVQRYLSRGIQAIRGGLLADGHLVSRVAREERCLILSRLMHPIATIALLALQCFVVLFVALHNWIPLGALNNVSGVRIAFPTGKLFVTTLINFTPMAIGLAATAFYFGRVYPGWVFWWLWITYGLACYGSFKAWWMPYLFRPDPALAARYQTMYAGTHSFMPEHNGIRPNTLHVLFDIVTLAILIDLAVLTR